LLKECFVAQNTKSVVICNTMFNKIIISLQNKRRIYSIHNMIFFIWVSKVTDIIQRFAHPKILMVV
jgi:hypothetical protein